jgi:GNAT superfamily N-acetyltransferase
MKKEIFKLAEKYNFYIDDLYLVLFRDVYPLTKIKLIEKFGIDFVKQMISQLPNIEYYFKCEYVHDTIVAFCVWNDNYLDFLFVEPSFRNQGLSKQMFNYYIEKVQTSKVVFDDVNLSKYYLNLGYIQTSLKDSRNRCIWTYTKK